MEEGDKGFSPKTENKDGDELEMAGDRRTASSCKNSESTRERPKVKHKERTAVTASSPRRRPQQTVAGDGESVEQRGEVSDGELGLRGAADLV
jgi:hypothetical protein